MSVDRGDIDEGVRVDAGRLLARGASDDVSADRRLAAAVDDLGVPDAWRLSDRARALVHETFAGQCGLIEQELRHAASRLLAERGAPEPALLLERRGPSVYPTLSAAGLLAERELMREMIGRARQAVLADTLVPPAPEGGDRPSLIVRLVEHPRAAVSNLASALMVAEAKRRDGLAKPRHSDLPAECHHRLVWAAAAVLRTELAPCAGGDQAAIDAALTDAALRALASHDEGERLEAVAMRLAVALGAPTSELGALLVEAFGDRRVALAIALLAQALGLDYDSVRDMVLDPVPDRFWLALRAAGLERPAIARIGLVLADSEPSRDLEAFADQLPAILAVPVADARAALAPLALHPDFRASLVQLARALR
ncbi:MAG: hypothetical protein A4S12_11550 [Proteobacteria bacterium SG_bin5]|nr:DUF2336 domain-containing protein [Sphingomonas sp.]OQW39377.1 MAG: hypothetical protein A4S12_11550 [Proteobacteria bacterium SG_bin5]